MADDNLRDREYKRLAQDKKQLPDWIWRSSVGSKDESDVLLDKSPSGISAHTTQPVKSLNK